MPRYRLARAIALAGARLHPLGTAILASIPAALLLWFTPQVIPNAAAMLFRGDYRNMSPSALHMGFIFFGVFSVPTLPFLVAARFWRRPGSIVAYWALLIPSAVVCVHLLLMHTVTTMGLARYIATMGLTPKRLLACGPAALGYLAVFGLFAWIVWPPGGYETGDERYAKHLR